MRWRVAAPIALFALVGSPAASSTAQVAPAVAGMTARAVLSPAQWRGWCAGTFRGEIWLVLIEPCPAGKACPAILRAPPAV